MSYGLRVRDASGNIVLDVTDRITRLHGTYSYTLGNAAATLNVTVAGAVDDGTWNAFTTGGHIATVRSGYIEIRKVIAGGETGGTLVVFRC